MEKQVRDEFAFKRALALVEQRIGKAARLIPVFVEDHQKGFPGFVVAFHEDARATVLTLAGRFIRVPEDELRVPEWFLAE